MARNLVDAQGKEKSFQEEFNALIKAKTSNGQRALEDMSKENGARDLNKNKAQAEVDSLKEQVANDEKYIRQTEKSLAEKEEWKDRQNLRAAEIQAIAQAIAILHSDDARDNLKKSTPLAASPRRPRMRSAMLRRRMAA